MQIFQVIDGGLLPHSAEINKIYELSMNNSTQSLEQPVDCS